MSRRPWLHVIASLALLVPPLAAPAQGVTPPPPPPPSPTEDYYPRTHLEDGTTPADLVMQDGHGKTVIVKILNLTPYTMEAVSASLADQTDRNRATAKSFTFAPVGVPSPIPPGTDATGLHGDTTAHPRSMVVAWNDGPGTVARSHFMWTMKGVDWHDCGSPGCVLACCPKKSDAVMGLWLTRDEPEDFGADMFAFMMSVVDEAISLIGLVLDPLNPLSWYGAFQGALDMADDLQFLADQAKELGTVPLYVSAYTIPERNRECYQRNNALTWAATTGLPPPPEGYLACTPGTTVGESGDGYAAQWGDTQSGPAPSEIVALTTVMRGRLAEQGLAGQDNNKLGYAPVVMVTVMTATQYDAAHVLQLARARPPMAGAQPGTNDLEKEKIVREARRFREKYGDEGRRALAWVIASYGPEQRQLLRDTVLTLLERNAISKEQEKFVHDLLKQAQQLVLQSRKEG